MHSDEVEKGMKVYHLKHPEWGAGVVLCKTRKDHCRHLKYSRGVCLFKIKWQDGVTSYIASHTLRKTMRRKGKVKGA